MNICFGADVVAPMYSRGAVFADGYHKIPFRNRLGDGVIEDRSQMAEQSFRIYDGFAVVLQRHLYDKSCKHTYSLRYATMPHKDGKQKSGPVVFSFAYRLVGRDMDGRGYDIVRLTDLVHSICRVYSECKTPVTILIE